MAAFAKIVKQARPPGRTLILEPWVFADDWSSKPSSPVCVGLRLMAEIHKSTARADAEKAADELHPSRGVDWIDAYNDAAMRQVVAMGICDPNDVDKVAPILQLPQEQVKFALSTRGVKFLFEAIDRYEIEASPIGMPAEKRDCERLAQKLAAVDPYTLPLGLRRLISHVLERLED